MNKLIFIIVFLLSTVSIFGIDYRVTDTGAIADDGLPDTSAFRATWEAAEQACGGTIFIPKGKFLIDGTVASNFSNCPFISLRILGEVGSEIEVSVGGQAAFVFSWMNSLEIRGVTFLGRNVPASHAQFTDAADLFYFTVVENIVIDSINVYGMAVSKSLFRIGAGKFLLTNSRLNGNAAYYSSNWNDTGAYVYGDNDGYGNAWQNIVVENVRFTDYANYKGQYISKTSDHMTGAYIFTKPQSISGAAQTTGRVAVKDCTFDEGSHTAISIYGASFVEIKGVGINHNATTGSTGVRLTNVKHALLTQNVGDWAITGRPFLTTQNVGYVKVSGLELRAGIRFWHNLGNTNMNIEYCEECATKPFVP